MITKMTFLVEAEVEHPSELDPVTTDFGFLNEAKLVYRDNDLRVRIVDSQAMKIANGNRQIIEPSV